MSSLDVAFFAFERWSEAKPLLRRYRLLGSRASILDGRILGANKESCEVSFLPEGSSEQIVWNVTGATFEYVESDDNMPEELTKLFVGRFLEIDFADDDELFLIGELAS